MPDNNVQYTMSLRDLLTGKLNEADAAGQRLNGTMSTLSEGLKGVGIALVAAFSVNAIGNFVQSMVEAGSTVENARTGLTTLLGDSAAAGQVIKNTMEDATKTPFAFEGLLAANKALIGANVNAEDARKTVLDLSNAIAATGGGDVELQRMVVNLQQIKNVGKATAMDIKQFAIAGINIYEVLAKATGKPIEAVKDMEVSYDLLTGALAKAHAAGGIYANGLENMAGNTSVQLSNVGDALFQLKVRMFDDLKPAISAVIGAVGKFVGILGNAWDWLVRNKDIVEAVGIGLTVSAALWGVYTLAINASAIGTAIMTAAQWALNTAMSANPIGLVVVAIGALVAAIVWAWKTFGQFRGVLLGVWETIKEFGRVVTDIFTGVGKVIAGVLTFNPKMVVDGAAQTINAISDAGTRMGGAFKKGFDEGMADFAKDQAVEAAKEQSNAPKALIKKGVGAVAPVTKGKKETAGATGNKSISISIKIDNLIKDFKIETRNITEGAGRVKEQVTQALLSAVNDSQIVAGQ